MYFTTSFHNSINLIFLNSEYKYNNGTFFQYSNTCMYYRCGAWWIHQFMRKILIWKFFEWMNVYTRFSFNDFEQKRELHLKRGFLSWFFLPSPFSSQIRQQYWNGKSIFISMKEKVIFISRPTKQKQRIIFWPSGFLASTAV